jgi:uncharacterized repeat protein (TIGR03803 family)
MDNRVLRDEKFMLNNKTLILFVVTSVAFLATASPALGASSEQVLYSFCSVSGCPDGQLSLAGMIFDKAGNLYGTTYGGGTFGYGAVFELIPNQGSWTEKVLHSFNANGKDGYFPRAALILDAAGNLYGTTLHGGFSTTCFDGCGTVFELTPGTNGKWTEKLLHEFSSKEGYWPIANLILDAAGNLYGTTSAGGGRNYGIVFELTLSGGKWTEKLLHEFSGKDGSVPNAGLILDTTGNLYGTTSEGGVSNYGIVFELTPGANGKWTESVLHEFNGKFGSAPGSGLILDKAGNLYGTTQLGGAYNEGTVFQLVPVSGKWTENVLHSFNPNGTDGYFPRANLILDAAANLYGTTVVGGTYGRGIVFELIPNNGTWTETVLHSFGNGSDGAVPLGGLNLDKAGNLYGTTENGGTPGDGTVFEVTP